MMPSPCAGEGPSFKELESVQLAKWQGPAPQRLLQWEVHTDLQPICLRRGRFHGTVIALGHPKGQLCAQEGKLTHEESFQIKMSPWCSRFWWLSFSCESRVPHRACCPPSPGRVPSSQQKFSSKCSSSCPWAVVWGLQEGAGSTWLSKGTAPGNQRMGTGGENVRAAPTRPASLLRMETSAPWLSLPWCYLEQPLGVPGMVFCMGPHGIGLKW